MILLNNNLIRNSMMDSTERFGELLVRLGAITEEDIQIILNYQKKHPDLRFGQIAVKLGFITPELLGRYF